MAKEARLRLQAWVKAPNLRLAKRDAKRFNKTIDSVVDTLLQDFFLMKQDEREKFYKRLPNKTLGRPVV